VHRYARHARAVGEDLAYLQGGPSSRQANIVLRMWLRSPAHRRVLLTRSWRRIGIGAVRRGHGRHALVWVTADFATGR
jgi:uncharacterized protein YkwD